MIVSWPIRCHYHHRDHIKTEGALGCDIGFRHSTYVGMYLAGADGRYEGGWAKSLATGIGEMRVVNGTGMFDERQAPQCCCGRN